MRLQAEQPRQALEQRNVVEALREVARLQPLRQAGDDALMLFGLDEVGAKRSRHETPAMRMRGVLHEQRPGRSEREVRRAAREFAPRAQERFLERGSDGSRLPRRDRAPATLDAKALEAEVAPVA